MLNNNEAVEVIKPTTENHSEVLEPMLEFLALVEFGST